MLKITLIACGNKMPSWVNEAIKEYSKRLKEYVALSVIEIPLQKRGKNVDLARILEKEAVQLVAAIPDSARIIAMEINGESFNSEQLAVKFVTLTHTNSHLCFIIGGPEGLTPHTLAHCHERWSLSSLTLPHPMVRIILFEAIYRAWSIIHNHPYHK